MKFVTLTVGEVVLHEASVALIIALPLLHLLLRSAVGDKVEGVFSHLSLH